LVASPKATIFNIEKKREAREERLVIKKVSSMLFIVTSFGRHCLLKISFTHEDSHPQQYLLNLPGL
jgi:hypothetical protein